MLMNFLIYGIGMLGFWIIGFGNYVWRAINPGNIRAAHRRGWT